MADVPGELLPVRDSLQPLRSVPFSVAAEGGDGRSPAVTIGIPTYRRGELLAEAVRSALAQEFDRPVEILVVDNDPDSPGAGPLLEAVPELGDHTFRYIVNKANLGHCGNFNRCIEQARARWLTVLHDDDLLEPHFLTVSFGELDADPSVDGVVGAKILLDQRPDRVGGSAQGLGQQARARVRALMMGVLNPGGASRRLTPKLFFWGPVAGNAVGFVFRTSCAKALGGYDPEEEPNADYWFYTRFAERFHLRQHSEVIAAVRIRVNECLNPATVRKMFSATHDFRRSLAGHSVPAWWRHISPFLLARSRVELRDLWDVEVPPEDIGRMIGQRLPGHHPYLIWLTKFALRGF